MRLLDKRNELPGYQSVFRQSMGTAGEVLIGC